MNPGELVAGRYRVVRELGQGGMGAVYLARDQEQDTDVALKVAVAAGHAYDESKSRFEREARLGCALGQSRGFVRVFDWGELSHGRLYLAMDLVKGAAPLDLGSGTLAQRLARLEAAGRLVERAHALGVIHRDLKPGNFLSDEAGEVWLTDFGLAKLSGEELDGATSQQTLLTRTGVAMGTPQFMPPEQFENSKAAGEAADVFALGVMLFYVLTGRFPYDGETPTEIFSKQIKTQVGGLEPPRARDLVPETPAKLDALCTLATQLDAGRRLSRAGRFVERLAMARTKLEASSAQVAPSLCSLSPDLGPPPESSQDSPRPTGDSGVEGSLLTQVPATDKSGFARVEMKGEAPGVLYQVWQSTGRKPALIAAFALIGIVASFTSYRIRARIRQVTMPGPQLEEPQPRGLPSADFLAPSPGLVGADAETEELLREATRGDVESMLDLAVRLERGERVDRDLEGAIQWYRRAAGQGNTDAMVCLGELYLEGVGVTESEPQARRWFRRAADAGNADGQVHLRYLDDMQAAKRQEHGSTRRSRYGR